MTFLWFTVTALLPATFLLLDKGLYCCFNWFHSIVLNSKIVSITWRAPVAHCISAANYECFFEGVQVLFTLNETRTTLSFAYYGRTFDRSNGEYLLSRSVTVHIYYLNTFRYHDNRCLAVCLQRSKSLYDKENWILIYFPFLHLSTSQLTIMFL